ncbi:RsmG family class I SAM-dependent methyltransferase [Candidatus Riflebacteria bacterium]
MKVFERKLFLDLASASGWQCSELEISSMAKLYTFFCKTAIPLGWVKVTDREDFLLRHLIDSVLPFSLKPELLEFNYLVDIGSGPGLPLFPVLSVFPSLRGLIIDRRTKLKNFYFKFKKHFPEIKFDYFIGSPVQLNRRFYIPEEIGLKVLILSRAAMPTEFFFQQIDSSSLKNEAILLYKGPGFKTKHNDASFTSISGCLADGRVRKYIFFTGNID